MTDPTEKRSNFLTDIIDDDLRSGKHTGVVTRFPPEPNGYLHIGHAKSIHLNWGLAQRYGGRFHLRYDDTNPVAEDEEFVDAIARDVCWLLEIDALEHVYWASNYFEQMYGFAVELVEKGLAYVDSQTPDEVRTRRGDFNTPGEPSPYRSRSVAENLRLLDEMRRGLHAEGTHTLRALIDMESPNMLMRDPLIYRIKHATHHNTGDAWCIYPMYDFAHCLEDAIEHVTHSICTLEFENNRELYDWIIENVSVPSRPRQYEFARLTLDYTVVSKRHLKRLVTERHVDGWDDPRMPTVAGLRRRGVTPASIRSFCELVGVAKNNSVVDLAKLEFAIRDDLNRRAPRAMAVLDPLEVTLTNVPDDFARTLSAPLWPEDFDRAESRELVLRKRILIERDDFATDPPDGWKRLSPGGVVRLRHGVAIACDRVIQDDDVVVRLECRVLTPDEEAEAAASAPIGVIHWLSEDDAVAAEVRLVDRLFIDPAPGADPEVDLATQLNPNSLVRLTSAKIEPWLRDQVIATQAERQRTGDPTLRVQFERIGYFAADLRAEDGAMVFNRIVGLKDSWARATGDIQDADLDTLRGEKERAKAEQAARSEGARREPEDVARERGTEVFARFSRLVGAGATPADALPISGSEAHTDFVAAHASHAASVGLEFVARTFVAYTRPSWRDDAEPPYSSSVFARFAEALASGSISGSDAKRLHAQMLETGELDATALSRVGDDEIGAAVDAALAANLDAVERYRAGKTQLLGFFVGVVMRATGGSADPDAVRRVLLDRLS